MVGMYAFVKNRKSLIIQGHGVSVVHFVPLVIDHNPGYKS